MVGSRDHRSAWIKTVVAFLFAVFAAISINTISNSVLQGHSFQQLEPSATTDAFLRILAAPHPGSLVEGALRAFGPDQALLFIAPAKQDFTMQVYYTISVLAYPRPVSAVICGEPGKGPSAIIDRVPVSAEIGGLIFFEADPGPWAAGGTRITSKMFVSPHTGAAPWPSFCR